MKSLKFLGIIGLLAILGAIFAAAFFFGGFFNVAASRPDPDPVNWVLEHVRAASIARHATDRPAARSMNPPWYRPGPRASRSAAA